jgi:hypothetical protein
VGLVEAGEPSVSEVAMGVNGFMKLDMPVPFEKLLWFREKLGDIFLEPVPREGTKCVVQLPIPAV